MEYNQELLNQIINELNVEPIIAKCLLSIGLTTINDCKKFLNPSFDDLTKLENYEGLEGVKERIQQAIDEKQKVLIYGDYDSDGICSTAMLSMFLKSKGLEVNYFIPDRREDGYGMSEETLEKVMEEYNPDLFITVDCGITNINEVEFVLDALGSDIVITDHHEPLDELPICPIFNPHLTKENAYTNLCGAGVVFRLIESLSSFDEALKYIDLAAIATIADMVPLTDDNRIIVAYGLNKLNSSPRNGLQALIKTFSNKPLSSSDIGFKLAPRINAVGRLANANEVVELFESDDPYIIKEIVDDINEFHNTRQTMTKKLCDEVEEQIQDYDFERYPIIILYSPKWDEGLIGIAAAKKMQDYKRPVILLTDAQDGLVKGSGRSIQNVNIFECVKNASSKLTRFGGHSQACGLSLQKDDIDSFRIEINEYFKSAYDNSVLIERDENVFDFSEVKNVIKVTKELELLEPYGQGNKKPLFSSVVNDLTFKPMKEGLEHVVYKSGKFQMVGFYLIDKIDILNSAIDKNIIFNLSLDTYNNVDYTQAIINEVRCVSFDDNIISNYVYTSLYPDTSIFHPKEMAIKDAIILANNSSYATAFLCFSKKTYDEFSSQVTKDIVKNAHFIESPCPNNAIFFDIALREDLTKYKNVIFLDKPISLGYIDEMKLNKDCNVFYVENSNGKELLKSYVLPYEKLGKIYIEIAKILQNKANTSIYDIFVDVEKTLNVNYNSFIVAICIFMDLGIFAKEGKFLKINKNVKNPINNSHLYKFIVEG